MRARDLGISIGLLSPGPLDAITDIAGVRVGHTTLIDGPPGPLRVGHGPVRSGVTVVLPHDGDVYAEPVYAGAHRLKERGVKIAAHTVCAEAMRHADERTCPYLYHRPYEACEADIVFRDQARHTVGDLEIDVSHTPGHAGGSSS